jgi:hypothetical protein
MALPADATAAARAVCEAHAGGVQKGGGIPAVAAKMGISAGVLYNKLSGAEDSHHKLTVRDLILIWLATGRIEHLQALAQTMNCVCFPVPAFAGVSDHALIELLCKIGERQGDFCKQLREALEDGQIDPAELAKLTALTFEWIGAIVEAKSRIEGLARG